MAISELESYIKGLKATKSKMMLHSQKQTLSVEIEKKEFELKKLIVEREEYMVHTSDKYVDKKVNEYYSSHILYEDKECTELKWSDEEWNEISDDESLSIIVAYNKATAGFSSDMLRKVALAPFFTNIFYMCDNNPYHFYGKPVVDLTYFQVEMFSFGMYYKHLMTDNDHKPPADIMEDPDALQEWYEGAKNAEKVLEKIKRNAKYWDTLFHDEKDRKEKLKFLDIGSASGEFVNAFYENGWDSYGIEPCKALVDYSKKQGGLINIQHTTVEEANYPENYFDFIHFWHVLEHVIEPRRVLYKIHYWLKPGGILNLGTPSPDSLVTKIYPKLTGYFDLGSVHTFIFPRQSLNTLLKTIGFEIKEHTVYSTLRTGNNFKAKIHNFLHHIYPKAVQNFQRVKAYKSSGI